MEQRTSNDRDLTLDEAVSVAVALQQAEQWAAAEDIYRTILEAAPCFSKVITVRPKDPEARRLLALAHCTLGEPEQAVKIFEEWLEDDPDDPVALHMLAACSGRNVPARASDEFIETTF